MSLRSDGNVSAYEVAKIYVALGNSEQAFQLLTKASAEHSFHLVNLNVCRQLQVSQVGSEISGCGAARWSVPVIPQRAFLVIPDMLRLNSRLDVQRSWSELSVRGLMPGNYPHPPCDSPNPGRFLRHRGLIDCRQTRQIAYKFSWIPARQSWRIWSLQSVRSPSGFVLPALFELRR